MRTKVGHGDRPRCAPSVGVRRGKDRSSERHELPRFEAFDGPTAFDGEGDEDLGAMEGRQQVERKLRIQPDPQLPASLEHLVHDATHPVPAPIDEALPGEGHVRIDARRGMNGGQQGSNASMDRVAVLDDQREPTRPIRRVDDLRHPVSSDDVVGCTRATARDGERCDEQLGLGVEGEVDRPPPDRARTALGRLLDRWRTVCRDNMLSVTALSITALRPSRPPSDSHRLCPS